MEIHILFSIEDFFIIHLPIQLVIQEQEQKHLYQLHQMLNILLQLMQHLY